MTSTVRCLIVDDEPAARELLAEMLAPYENLEIVGTAGDTAAGIRLIGDSAADVLFLDIRLGDGSGFDIVDALAEMDLESPPIIIFVTAYDEHAIQAFEAGALDYLLKPYDEERLNRTVERIRRRAFGAAVDVSTIQERLQALPVARTAPLRRLPVQSEGRIQLIPVSAVTWIEADRKHVTVYVMDGQGRSAKFSLRRTMQSLEDRLDPEHFIRVSRWAIINIDQMRHAEAWSHGEYLLVLKDGSRVPTTPGYRSRIQGLLKGS